MARMILKDYEGKLTPLNEGVWMDARNIRPNEIEGGDNFGYKVVARAWDSWNGWCAYRGPITWTDTQVMDYGDELSEDVAKLLFTALARSGRIYGGT